MSCSDTATECHEEVRPRQGTVVQNLQLAVVVVLDDLSGDCQAEADAILGCREVGVEDLVAYVLAERPAPESENSTCRPSSSRETEISIARSSFWHLPQPVDAVAKQVDEDLLQLRLIGGDHRLRRGQRDRRRRSVKVSPPSTPTESPMTCSSRRCSGRPRRRPPNGSIRAKDGRRALRAASRSRCRRFLQRRDEVGGWLFTSGRYRGVRAVRPTRSWRAERDRHVAPCR